MSVTYHSNAEAARATWQVLCAKHGLPEAANIGIHVSTMPEKDLHEIRKVTRQAVNKITDTMKPGDYDDKTTDALIFAGSVVAAVNQTFERIDEATRFHAKKNGTSTGSVSVLRNADDFSRHYGNNQNGQDGPMDIADFLRGVAGMKTTPAVQNALSVGTDASGGFSVPSILMPGILNAMVPVSSLMQAGASITVMEEGAKSYSFAAIDSIPTGAWRNESAAIATSDPALRSILVVPQSYAFEIILSRELLADGHGMTQAILTVAAQSFAREFDRVGLLGTGISPEPRGILNTTGIQLVTNGTNGAAVPNYANVLSAVSAILGADCPLPSAAIMSPRNLVKFNSLVSTTGEYLEAPSMLQNMKMIATSQIPNDLVVGTSSDTTNMFIGSFEYLNFCMRESISIQMLREAHANTGQVSFICHARADVILTYPKAFALVTGIRP
jgi:HK97 family phage major capsid protein